MVSDTGPGVFLQGLAVHGRNGALLPGELQRSLLWRARLHEQAFLCLTTTKEPFFGTENPPKFLHATAEGLLCPHASSCDPHY